MSIKKRIAFYLFSAVAIVLFATAIRFLMSDTIMPYHQVAMGDIWVNFEPGVQVMTLNFMRAAGLGFLVASVSAFILLFIPFRKGERWARHALTAVLLTHLIPMVFIVNQVRTSTAAEPPLGQIVFFIAATLAGYYLSGNTRSIPGQRS